MNQPAHQLKRNLSLSLVTFYGVGTILGAGIYVLIGHVAGVAGLFTPFAFVTAALIAGFSAFSYAELVARYPKSAGEAVYIDNAFNLRFLSIAVGIMLILIGLVSTSVLIQGFYGYLNDFIPVPKTLTLVICTLVLCGIVSWGISQSVWLAAIITVIEIIGLVIIVWVGREGTTELVQNFSSYVPDMSFVHWQGIFLGAFLAFYAFIGFEDMVNVAEEVREPRRNLPRAIVLALVITTLLYLVVSVVAVTAMPLSELAKSDAPLAELYRYKTGEAATIINIISLLSLVNGALVQLVMASRILYGMGNQSWIPTWFGHVNPVTRTPINATLVVSTVILIVVLALPLLSLAKITSFITLTVFALINLALIRLKTTHKHVDLQFRIPIWVPIAGLLASSLLLIVQISEMLTS